MSHRLKQANSLFTKQTLAGAIVGISARARCSRSCTYLRSFGASRRFGAHGGAGVVLTGERELQDESVYCLVQLHRELICVCALSACIITPPPACCYSCTMCPVNTSLLNRGERLYFGFQQHKSLRLHLKTNINICLAEISKLSGGYFHLFVAIDA